MKRFMKKFLMITGIFIFLAITTTANANVLFQEDFDGNGPGFSAWTIIDYDGDNTWEEVSGSDNLVPGGSGNAAAADAWDSWYGMNDVLWSPSIDVAGYTDITLTTGVAVVDSWGYDYAAILLKGNGWSASREFISWDNEDYTNEAASWDITAALDGATGFQLGFWFLAMEDDGWSSYGYFGADNIEVTGNQVPVPAAVWLLGSGLLGLIGIRRKK